LITIDPSSFPPYQPSSLPTSHPEPPTPSSSLQRQTTTAVFYAVGDAPYTEQQERELKEQMLVIPSDAEFVIHIGDIRNAEDGGACQPRDYETAESILRLSPVPVFVILGDNDWNDCSNPNRGLQLWNDTFFQFESSRWDHSFGIVRQPGRVENFSFVHKGALFIGLNIVGGKVLSRDEWTSRLTDQFEWTRELILGYNKSLSASSLRQGGDGVSVGRVVIFGHANPNNNHAKFFGPLRNFIRDELRNGLPILYINGDKHQWRYSPNYYNQTSFLRLMLRGGTSEPPLRVSVNMDGTYVPTNQAFTYDRRLSM